MLVLPEEHRKLFKDPFGELHPDMDSVIPLIANRIVYAVGDVVTHNLQKKGIIPAIAVVDGQTMRLPCSRMPAMTGNCIRVENPPGTITDELTRAIGEAVTSTPVTIFVNGEEDLAVIPLVLAAPDGTIVLYGQPHKGVVLRRVNAEAKSAARALMKHFIRVDP
ncbi:MAG: GTP-dependent dephospho-CoA kinase family protein [Methanoregula sp.]|nr:GTP-dependent dephospho-CoA kinase family protein [Methanoregula sp.]